MKDFANVKYVSTIVILVITFLLCVLLLVSCGLQDDDFTDIQVIESIIKVDEDALFGIEVVDDGGAQDVDTVQNTLKTRAGELLALDKSKSTNIDFLPRIGRRVRIEKRIIEIPSIERSDTMVTARVTYVVNGEFIVETLEGDHSSKHLEHEITRHMTFVRRESSTGDPWTRVSVSAAFGSSPGSNLALDTLTITYGDNSIVVTDPFQLNLLEESIPIVSPGMLITIKAKVRNNNNTLDKAIGFIKTGHNRLATGRFKILMRDDGRGEDEIENDLNYTRTIRVSDDAVLGFNQLVVDFVTTSTIFVPIAPYDSFLLFIPVRVQ